MQAAQPGYDGDVLLAAGDDKRRVRQHLQAAADELNQVLDFRPIKDKTRMQFRVITPEERTAAQAGTPGAAGACPVRDPARDSLVGSSHPPGPR
ncbi:MAG: hypothetical protein M3380_17630 [Chloroflexota bacterium]|nr:hypothetical protein [Chloroflexota bacterium]